MNKENIYIDLNKYIKKFYLFKTFQGIIYFVLFTALLYFTVIILNFLFYLPTHFKTIFYWIFLVFLILISFKLVLIPFFKYLKIFPTISYVDASIQISNIYSDIQDKLINILELINSKQKSILVSASINQKYNELKIFDFSKAINYKELFKYLKLLFFPVLLYIIAFIFNSHSLKIGYNRFANYSKYYSKPLPFKFYLLNKDLFSPQGNDFKVILDLRGDLLPDEVFIDFGSNSIVMNKKTNSKHVFYYTFKSISKNINFYFKVNNYRSKIYTIKVIPTPKILKFSVKIIPPKYTRKLAKFYNNTGDFIVPYGSRLIYKFSTKNTDSLYLSSDSLLLNSSQNANVFLFKIFATKSLKYNVLALNNYAKKRYFTFNLKVIPDLFPSINVKFLQDSAVLSKFYFYGKITDDYGFSQLNFNYKVIDKNRTISKSDTFQKISIPFNSSVISQQFYFAFNFSDLNISTDKIIYYFFSVNDNDKFHFYKLSKTSMFTFFLPSEHQLDSIVNDFSDKSEDKFNEIKNLSFQLQNEINSFKQKELNENLSQWEKRQFLEDLVFKQNKIKNLLDSLKNINSKKFNNLKNFSKSDSNLLKKQQQIQDLLDKLLSPEMKNLLEKLKKLQENFKNNQLKNILNKSTLNYKKLDNELNRSHELLKRLTLEQNLNSKINQFNQLSKDFKNISHSLNKSKHISTQQKDSVATEKFKILNLISDYDSLLKFNQTLIKPYRLDSLSNLRKSLNNDLNKLSKSMSTNKKRQSQQNSDNTAKDLKQISNKLKQVISSNNSQEKGEDQQTIQFLLTNILTLSFDQEQIFYQTKHNFSVFSNNFKQIKLKQLFLKSQFKVINDSLNALALRNPAISKIITDQIFSINQNFDLVNNEFSKSNKKSVLIHQRKIITSANKIALMLEESLKNMKNNSGSGNGNSKNNRNASKDLSNLKNFQKRMENSLQQMLNQMKKGKQPTSQQLGIQLAKREAFNQMLQDFINNNNLSEQMKSLLNQSQKLNNQIKNDIINNNLNIQSLNRDKQISSKLLESEKAENKRKYSNKRIATTSANIQHTVPNNIRKAFKLNSNFNELFQTNNLFLNNFYKKYYNEYFIRLRNQ